MSKLVTHEWHKLLGIIYFSGKDDQQKARERIKPDSNVTKLL